MWPQKSPMVFVGKEFISGRRVVPLEPTTTLRGQLGIVTKLNIDGLQEGLRTKRFGKRIFFSHSVPSTNDWAKELAALGAEEGTIIVAETQRTGRGRLGRTWVSPMGGLWFSVILKPKTGPSESAKLVFVASLAVAEVLHEFYRLDAETKWPNDVLVHGNKICGILAEMNTTGKRVNFAIVGIGLNANVDVKKVFPTELAKVSTSLENELGKKAKLHELFTVLVERLENLYTIFLKEGSDPILKEWKKHARFLGGKVKVNAQSETLAGLACDVSSNGALVLKLENGTTRDIFVGEITSYSY